MWIPKQAAIYFLQPSNVPSITAQTSSGRHLESCHICRCSIGLHVDQCHRTHEFDVHRVGAPRPAGAGRATLFPKAVFERGLHLARRGVAREMMSRCRLVQKPMCSLFRWNLPSRPMHCSSSLSRWVNSRRVLEAVLLIRGPVRQHMPPAGRAKRGAIDWLGTLSIGLRKESAAAATKLCSAQRVPCYARRPPSGGQPCMSGVVRAGRLGRAGVSGPIAAPVVGGRASSSGSRSASLAPSDGGRAVGASGGGSGQRGRSGPLSTGGLPARASLILMGCA